MTGPAPSVVAPGDELPGARRLARGITATWWYTASAVLFLEAALVLSWVGTLAVAGLGPAGLLTLAGGGVLWVGSTVFLVMAYRHRRTGVRARRWPVIVMLLVAAGFGATAVALSGSWQLGFAPLGQSLVLLAWPRGVRARVAVAVTAVLVALWFIDARFGAGGAALAPGVDWWLPAFYSAALPAMTVASLWWWDVLVALDDARASQSRLAATQERLRLATDVHDLQGHHLQVIALQLELADRLMDTDRDAAMAQLRAARASVDEARQSTRDLAMRYRSVPLGDELANARDLLRAAGIEVAAEIAADADLAPASALGPVIRETTTNALRHGGGRRARLELGRTDGGWRYLIANDLPADETSDTDGSGLDGLRRRLSDVGGSLEVEHADGWFRVVATVPDTAEAPA